MPEFKDNKGFKMKGFSGFGNSPTKKKTDPDAPGTPGKPGYEPPVHVTDYLTKDKSSGPWEEEKEISREEIEESFTIGEKLENFDTPSDVIDSQIKLEKNE